MDIKHQASRQLLQRRAGSKRSENLELVDESGDVTGCRIPFCEGRVFYWLLSYSGVLHYLCFIDCANESLRRQLNERGRCCHQLVQRIDPSGSSQRHVAFDMVVVAFRCLCHPINGSPRRYTNCGVEFRWTPLDLQATEMFALCSVYFAGHPDEVAL